MCAQVFPLLHPRSIIAIDILLVSLEYTLPLLLETCNSSHRIPSCPCPVCSRSFKSSVEGLKYNACSSLFNFLFTGFSKRLFSWLTGYSNSPRKDCTADVVLFLLIVIWHHCEQFNEIRNTFCTENGTDCNNNNNFPPLVFNSCSWIAQIKKVTVALLPCPVFHVALYAWEGCNWRTGHASGKWLFH